MLLEVKDLEMHYHIKAGWVRAVDNISFSLEQGDALGIVGESGCGKSSLAFTILKLLPKNGHIMGGNVFFDGQDLLKLSDEEIRAVRWKKVSMIFQAAMNALNPVQKVGDQLIEALQAHEEVDEETAKNRVKELFELVEILPSRMYNYPHEFSAGMKQRAIIAMSLICNPDLIIADEPTSALDVIVQDQIMQDIKELQIKYNIAMILISHDLALIAEFCEKLAVMYAGKIFELASTESIFENTSNPYTNALLSSVPNIKGTSRKLISLPGKPPSLLTPPHGCRFEPRCKYAKEVCKQSPPEMVEVEAGHYSRCHLAKELDLKEWRKVYV